MVDVTLRPPYPRERNYVPIVLEAEGAAGTIGTGAENVVAPVASRYTDWAIPTHQNLNGRTINK